jgi:hypothetical protein
LTDGIQLTFVTGVKVMEGFGFCSGKAVQFYLMCLAACYVWEFVVFPIDALALFPP